MHSFLSNLPLFAYLILKSGTMTGILPGIVMVIFLERVSARKQRESRSMWKRINLFRSRVGRKFTGRFQPSVFKFNPDQSS